MAKKDIKQFLLRVLFDQRLLSTVKCSFDKAFEFFPTTSQKNALKIRKTWKDVYIFSKKYLSSSECSYGHVEGRFDTLPKKIRPNAKMFRSMSIVGWKKFIFLRKKTSFHQNVSKDK